MRLAEPTPEKKKGRERFAQREVPGSRWKGLGEEGTDQRESHDIRKKSKGVMVAPKTNQKLTEIPGEKERQSPVSGQKALTKTIKRDYRDYRAIRKRSSNRINRNEKDSGSPKSKAGLRGSQRVYHSIPCPKSNERKANCFTTKTENSPPNQSRETKGGKEETRKNL